MSKESYVQLDAVRKALEEVIKDKNTIAEVLDLLNESTVTSIETAEDLTPKDNASSETGDKDGPPKVKQQYVILVSDPDKLIKKDLTGWVLQMPEDEDVREVVDGIKKAAYNYNASKKGQKYPVRNIGQAVNSVGNRFMKPYSIKVKTKEAVYVVTTDNVLPTK